MRRGFGGAGRQLARFIEDRSGNFAVITAGILTTILLSVGFGINTAQMVLTRSNLLNALDSAVTSTARDLTTGAIPEDDAEKTVKAFLFTNGGTGFASADKISLDSLVVDLEYLGRESYMPLFVVLRPGLVLDTALTKRIKAGILD